MKALLCLQMADLKMSELFKKKVTFHRNNTDRNLIFELVHGISNMKVSYRIKIILKRDEGYIALTMTIFKSCDFFF